MKKTLLIIANLFLKIMEFICLIYIFFEIPIVILYVLHYISSIMFILSIFMFGTCLFGFKAAFDLYDYNYNLLIKMEMKERKIKNEK